METLVSQRPTPPGLRPWRPGESGNLNGRPKKTPDERKAEEYLRQRSLKYARKLDAMIFDPDTSEAGVLRALELALGYGIGKPSVRDDSGLPPGITLIVAQLPPSDQPVAGCLNSPNPLHVDPRARARIGMGSPQHVIDAASEVTQ